MFAVYTLHYYSSCQRETEWGTEDHTKTRWPGGFVMIFLVAIYLALIATFWKEPIVVQFSQFVAAWIETLATREDEGQGMVEYGLIIALVALVAAVGVRALGVNISALLNGINFA